MNDSNENIWIERHFETLKNSFKSEKEKKLLKEGLDTYKWNKNPPFIFCLSANKDLLSQWRAYSQDGQGVSIGFNTKCLEFENRIPSPNVYAQHTFGLAKVDYNNYSQKKIVNDLCDEVKKMAESSEKFEKMFSSIHLGLSLVSNALVFKNSNFREEKEWRIIHTPTEKYEESLENLSELRYRYSENRIKSYFEYEFGTKFNSNLIPEIILGPKCNMQISEMENFIKSVGLKKTKVLRSNSTYR
ncbi:DUF2971 domain-containing protein [Flavobacterium terrigena]|uniref:DUF2971 domain-containing protein n=2 Tax=Flavobacterium terrigena TaxID=402734 RepID=A0A1H6XYA6_9FLAO|nr:Protein of unknown function [Flavobacterium terrigena]